MLLKDLTWPEVKSLDFAKLIVIFPTVRSSSMSSSAAYNGHGHRLGDRPGHRAGDDGSCAADADALAGAFDTSHAFPRHARRDADGVHPADH